MSRPADARKYPRLQLPVYVESPDLARASVEGKDISAGGLFLTVRGLPAPPEEGAELDISFQIAGQAFPNCKARVAWTHQTRPGTWGIGVEVHLPDEERARLARQLDQHLADPRPLWHA